MIGCTENALDFLWLFSWQMSKILCTGIQCGNLQFNITLGILLSFYFGEKSINHLLGLFPHSVSLMVKKLENGCQRKNLSLEILFLEFDLQIFKPVISLWVLMQIITQNNDLVYPKSCLPDFTKNSLISSTNRKGRYVRTCIHLKVAFSFMFQISSLQQLKSRMLLCSNHSLFLQLLKLSNIIYELSQILHWNDTYFMKTA